MSVVKLYNKLQKLIKSYDYYNLLITLNEEKLAMKKDISIKLNNISINLDNGSLSIMESKDIIYDMFNNINIEANLEELVKSLKDKKDIIKIQIDSLFKEISCTRLLEVEVDNFKSDEDKLKDNYYNYCIRRLKESLGNYEKNKSFKYDYLNDMLKEELEKEVFINKKSRVRKEEKGNNL